VLNKYLVHLIDRRSGVLQKVWVKSTSDANMQKFFDDNADKLPGLKVGMTHPVVVSVKEMQTTYIRDDIINKVFPVVVK
jgi:Cu/Ag efflux pump CusA